MSRPQNRRSRAHIQCQVLDENSHLSVNRAWNHLLPVNEGGGAVAPIERPMAVVGGIGRGTNQAREAQPSARLPNGGGGAAAGADPSTFVRAMAIPHCRQHTDWDALCEFREREMNEVRQRAAHMENTMRWWLLSAEQWRQKWAAVKGERNRLREENGRLRNALAKANGELRTLRSADGGGEEEEAGTDLGRGGGGGGEAEEKRMEGSEGEGEETGQKDMARVGLKRRDSF